MNIFTLRLVIALFLHRVCSLASGDVHKHMKITANSTIHELHRRGFHEEAVLADTHPSEYFHLPPYYPSRMFNSSLKTLAAY